MKATASIGPPLSQADAAQTEQSQQGCQPTDRHIDEEDHLPAPVRQELTANPRPSDPAQRSQRANEAHSSPSLMRRDDGSSQCQSLRPNQRAKAPLDHTTQYEQREVCCQTTHDAPQTKPKHRDQEGGQRAKAAN